MVRREQHARRQLLRGGEVRFQRLAERSARERHDPLVAHALLLRLDRHRDAALGADEAPEDRAAPAVAGQSAQRNAGATRYGSHSEIMGTLRHQQADRTVALQLEGERAAELEGRGQEHRGGHRLAEQLAHDRWVIGMCAQLAPGALEAHPVAAHRLLLEYEATHLVAARDSVRVHLAKRAFCAAARSAAPGWPCRRSPS